MLEAARHVGFPNCQNFKLIDFFPQEEEGREAERAGEEEEGEGGESHVEKAEQDEVSFPYS